MVLIHNPNMEGIKITTALIEKKESVLTFVMNLRQLHWRLQSEQFHNTPLFESVHKNRIIPRVLCALFVYFQSVGFKWECPVLNTQ